MRRWRSFKTGWGCTSASRSDLPEVMDHTPLQVLMGTLLGLGVGLLVENGRYFQYYERRNQP